MARIFSVQDQVNWIGEAMTKSKAKSKTKIQAKIDRPNRRNYKALAAWADERFGPDKRWADLPLSAPVRGRPAKGHKPLGLKAKTVKLPEAVWRELRAAAKRHGVTVNGVLVALGIELVRRSALDSTIDRLIEERLLLPANAR
jgi:hypothetical protein